MTMKKLLIYALLQLTIGWLSAQVYHVGDLYTAEDGSQGIVYYLFPDGSGWVVALQDCPSAVWIPGNTWVDIPNLPNVSSNSHVILLNDTAGYSNTQIIRAFLGPDVSAAALVVDFGHGWYLPAISQLSMLYAQLPVIEAPLYAAGGNTLAPSFYYSSSEYDGFDAWGIDFASDSLNAFAHHSGSVTVYPKNVNANVRAVRSFLPPQNVYDTTLTYQWNTGSTEPHFHDVPLQSTTYTVTVSNAYGCTNSASANVTVIDNNPQVIYDTICQSAIYENYGFAVSAQETAEVGEIVRTHTVSAAGCESEITLFLTVLPHDTVYIEQTAGQSFVWNGVTYTEDGTYTQHFNNQNGCDSTVFLTLTLDGGIDPDPGPAPDTIPFGENDTLLIYLPNAITPTRNDGLNDYFCIPEKYRSFISSFEIQIFNRWGTVVYRATDKNFRWDGRINGKIFFNVVYNYLIFFEDIIGRPYILRGSITIL